MELGSCVWQKLTLSTCCYYYLPVTLIKSCSSSSASLMACLAGWACSSFDENETVQVVQQQDGPPERPWKAWLLPAIEADTHSQGGI